MKLFFSAELDAAVDDDFGEIRAAVQDGFNAAFANRPLLKGHDEIGFIPIIVADRDRPERRYVNGPRRIIDYRLRIPFRSYRAAATGQRLDMILHLLAEVLAELRDRGIVTPEDAEAFRRWRPASGRAGGPGRRNRTGRRLSAGT